MRVQELQIAWVACLQFFPELPDREVPFANIGVMKQDHGAGCELGQPTLEIMADRVVGVKSVDVQEVDRPIGEIARGLIERHPQQSGEMREVLLVKRAHRPENIFAISAGMLIALPGVNRIASRRTLRFDHRLAEREIGVS